MSPSPALLPALLAALLAGAAAVRVLSLDGGGWSVSSANGSVRAAARVPGGVYSDLQAAGVLPPDLLRGAGDQLSRWVAYDNWTYERAFHVPPELLGRSHVQLLLHGADTVAEVAVNGRPAAAAANMFVRHRAPVRALLRPGPNTVAVRFASPALEARARARRHRQDRGYPVPPACVPAEYRGECHANFLRKMQASFGWDWGPAFPSVGLWKSVSLEAFDSAVLRAATTRFSPRGPSLSVRAHLEAAPGVAELRGRLSASLRLPGLRLRAQRRVSLAPGPAGRCEAELAFDPLPVAPLWWPNGEGQQPLFPLELAFLSERGELSNLSVRVAFRTVELVQEPVRSGRGLTFFLRVNGRPIFAKGSNWIPLSVFPELGADPAGLRRLLGAARDSHMNMLRVWGGGVYESDAFYELADELGLLIWQDLMFACSMYPADESSLASAAEEVRQQVLRLQRHPSVALWAANNENEIALAQSWYGTWAQFPRYRADYVRLYVDTLRAAVLQLDPTRPFVVSSPSNGRRSEQEGYVARRPGDPLYGDVHHYDYLTDAWAADGYPRPRFASEYGLQSLPAVATLRAAAADPAAALSLDSELLRARQHHGGGYAEMARLLAMRFRLPAAWQRPEAFPAFVFLSQMYQAVGVQTQTESYRRLRGRLLAGGEGLCMGALYWQLNDVWQAPSWSSIDSAGRWKPLQHLAGEFLAPVLASPELDPAGGLAVFALNDRPQPLLRVQLQASAGRWADALADGEPAWTNLSDFRLEAACSQPVLAEPLARLLARLPGCGPAPPAACFLRLRLRALPGGAALGPERAVLPAPPSQLRGLRAPRVALEAVAPPGPDGSLALTLAAAHPAAFLWLEAADLPGRFSRNAFLLAERRVSLRFLPEPGAPPPSAARLRAQLRVASLHDHVPAPGVPLLQPLRPRPLAEGHGEARPRVGAPAPAARRAGQRLLRAEGA